MSLFTIDTAKCKRDYICAANCPLGLIEKGNGVPRPGKDAEDLCVGCGHCVSACPATTCRGARWAGSVHVCVTSKREAIVAQL